MKFLRGSVAFQLEVSVNEIFMGHVSSHDGQGDLDTAAGQGPHLGLPCSYVRVLGICVAMASWKQFQCLRSWSWDGSLQLETVSMPLG